MSLVYINTDGRDEIASLPRIGPTLADRIISDREIHGPFRNFRDMWRVSGVSPGLTNGLFGRVSFRVVEPAESGVAVAKANKQSSRKAARKPNKVSPGKTDRPTRESQDTDNWIDEICTMAAVILSHNNEARGKAKVHIKRKGTNKIGRIKSPGIRTSHLVTDRLVTQCARGLDVNPANLQVVLKSVCEPKGLLHEGRSVVTLYGNILWDQLKSRGLRVKKLGKRNKDILHRKQPEKYRRKGSAEYERLTKAMRLHPDATMISACWGMFHMPGSHYKQLGYPTVYAFVQAQHSSEIKQLEDFLRLLSGKKFNRALRKARWKKFARLYFGKDYRKYPRANKLLKLGSTLD